MSTAEILRQRGKHILITELQKHRGKIQASSGLRYIRVMQRPLQVHETRYWYLQVSQKALKIAILDIVSDGQTFPLLPRSTSHPLAFFLQLRSCYRCTRFSNVLSNVLAFSRYSFHAKHVLNITDLNSSQYKISQFMLRKHKKYQGVMRRVKTGKFRK